MRYVYARRRVELGIAFTKAWYLDFGLSVQDPSGIVGVISERGRRVLTQLRFGLCFLMDIWTPS